MFWSSVRGFVDVDRSRGHPAWDLFCSRGLERGRAASEERAQIGHGDAVTCRPCRRRRRVLRGSKSDLDAIGRWALWRLRLGTGRELGLLMELVCGASRNSAGGTRWPSAAPATWNFHLQLCRPPQFMPTRRFFFWIALLQSLSCPVLGPIFFGLRRAMPFSNQPSKHQPIPDTCIRLEWSSELHDAERAHTQTLHNDQGKCCIC